MKKQNARHSRFKKAVVSVVAAASMAISGIGGSFSNVVFGAEAASVDSASAVNYSSIFGRAVDYGILAREFEQKTHMETTLATYKFTNHGNNNDVDLTDTGTAQFIFGKLGDKSTEIILGKVGKNTKTFNIEAPEEIFYNFDPKASGDDRARGSKIVRQDNFASIATIYPKISDESVIKANIDRMIGNIAEKSAIIDQKAKSNDYKVDLDAVSTNDGTHFYLNLDDDEYENRVVYVNVSDSSVLQNAVSSTGQFHIIKRSSTVVAMNVDTANDIKIDKYGVTVVDGDGKKGEEILSDTTHSGDISAHNKAVNQEIAQKVIWNVPNSKNVKINISAGAFMVPSSDSVVDVSSSAGWLAAGGEVYNSGEWHYIYEGTSEDTNSDLEGQIHFAARKAFTDKYNGKSTVENTSMYAEKGKYIFHFYETAPNYSESSYSEIPKLDSDGNSVQIINEATNKIKFPVLTFYTDISSCPAGKEKYFVGKGSSKTFYYVIKEENAGATLGGIYNSDGEIDLKLVVRNDNGVLKYNVSSLTYLDSSKSEASLYRENKDIDMSGIEFSLGAFFNLDEPETIGETETGAVEIRKENESGKIVEGAVLMLSSDSASLSSAHVQGAVAFDRTERSIKWTSSNSSVYISNLPDGTYSLSEVVTPEGYEKAQDITDIRIEGGFIKNTEKENGNTVDAVNNKIVMLDKIGTSTTTTTETSETTETTTVDEDNDSSESTTSKADTSTEATTSKADTSTEATTSKADTSTEATTSKADSDTGSTTSKAESSTEATSSSHNEDTTSESGSSKETETKNTTVPGTENSTEKTSENTESTSQKGDKDQKDESTTQPTTTSGSGTKTDGSSENTTNADDGKTENSTEKTSENNTNPTSGQKSDESTEGNTSETADQSSGSGKGSRNSSSGDMADNPINGEGVSTDDLASGSAVEDGSGSKSTVSDEKTETTTAKKSSSKSDEGSSSGSGEKSGSSSGSSSSKASKGSSGGSSSGGSSISGSVNGRRAVYVNSGSDGSSDDGSGDKSSTVVVGDGSINKPTDSSENVFKNSSGSAEQDGSASEDENGAEGSSDDISGGSYGNSSVQNEDEAEEGGTSSNPEGSSANGGFGGENGGNENGGAGSGADGSSNGSAGGANGASGASNGASSADYAVYSSNAAGSSVSSNSKNGVSVSGGTVNVTSYNSTPGSSNSNVSITGSSSGSSLPQTGSSAGTQTMLGLGMFFMAVGTLLLKKNKKFTH